MGCWDIDKVWFQEDELRLNTSGTVLDNVKEIFGNRMPLDSLVLLMVAATSVTRFKPM
jgi:hypothetical protein